MNLTRTSRTLLTALALFFGAVGLEIWMAPAQAAHRFGIEAIRAEGLLALRADLGGLFVGLALFCGAAAWTARRRWVAAAALLLVAIILGRSIGWIADGRSGSAMPELAIELAALALLGFALRGSRRGAAAASAEAAERQRPLRLRWVVGAALLVITGGTAAALLSPGVQQWLYGKGAAMATDLSREDLLADDAMRVLVVGSSAPLPSTQRAKASVAVFAGGKYYVVDTGPESVENLVTWGVPLDRIGAVLMTHFHSDHVGDLGELQLQTWAGGRPGKLEVYGGPGVDRLVAGFNEAYALDQGYRTTHHGEKVMPSATWGMVARTVELDGPATAEKSRTGFVLEDGGLRITAIEVDHAPIAPAYAYRFDYRGRSVVITGDLKDHPPLARGAAGADVLVSEAIALNLTRALGSGARESGNDQTAAIMHDIEDYHITPEQAARIANQAGVELLVYYHLLPSPDGPIARRLFAQGVDAVRRGGWTIADDGSLYTLPFGTKEVEIGAI